MKTTVVASEHEAKIINTKHYRKDLDEILQRLKASAHQSRERSIAITKIQEAIMWLGMDLKELAGGKSCYKHGYDPQSPEVEPTADGLEL